jgi:hypothetical protein
VQAGFLEPPAAGDEPVDQKGAHQSIGRDSIAIRDGDDPCAVGVRKDRVVEGSKEAGRDRDLRVGQRTTG